MAMKAKAPHSQRHYQARAKIAKALANPSRLCMLDALADREMCVCELTDLVGADQSTVSKHLTVLKQAGLIGDRREGSKVYCYLKVACLRGFWNCIETVLKKNLEEQQALLGR